MSSLKLMVLFFAATALVYAGAQRYDLRLFQDSVVNGKELKSGDYKLVVEDDSKVTISSRGTKVEANVRTKVAETKFSSTSVRYDNGDGKFRIKEIRLGGTNKVLTFDN